jgi:uncharacterized protein YecE (DUF72 family)
LMQTRQVSYYIGTSGWTYPHWKNVFYPPGTPQAQWFDYYARQFNAVEVNATFYRSFSDRVYAGWQARAPEGFKYVLKVPRLVTHLKHLQGVEEDIRSFCRSASLLGDHLGLLLLQLAPDMPYDPDLLRRALLAFGSSPRVAVEFRHSQWLNDEVMGLLQQAGAALCCADSPRSRLSARLTSSSGYLRLHGRRSWYASDYSRPELEEIALAARQMAAEGAAEVYIFFNNDVGGYAPPNAADLAALLNE